MIQIRHPQQKNGIIKRNNIPKILVIVFSLMIILTLTGVSCTQDLIFHGTDPTAIKPGETSTEITAAMRENITQAVWRVIRWTMDAATIVGTIFFMLSGFFYITALGDKEKIDKAKKGMLWSLIAILILLSCIVVVRYVFNDVLGLQTKI